METSPSSAGVSAMAAPLLERRDPASLGLRADRLARLCAIIEQHVAEGRYPGAQVAIARHGKLALFRSFGRASLEEETRASDLTLWRLYSNTKVLVAAGIWLLVEDGLVTFQDRIADHVPEFARHGKGDITINQALTHQAGFPSALDPIDREAWEDHALLRRLVCDISLEWTPGSRVHYHRRAAHWTLAVLIEAVTRMDFRHFLRTHLLQPLGLDRHLFTGLPAAESDRVATSYALAQDGRSHVHDDEANTHAFRAACIPGTGAIGSALGMAAFYQMLLSGGCRNGVRVLSPGTIAHVTRNHTGDRVDSYMKMAMHRGLGPHVRGTTETIRGLGTLASPCTYGHGGVGTSYCWADPRSGTSFAYVSNSRIPDPWHSRRLDILSNCAHAAIEET
jgi:CubicO group peptidase (beta-lactamase class C family)